MSDTWLAFARTGNPQTRALAPWPVYDSRLGAPRWSSIATSRVVDDPRGDERRLFEQVPYVQPGT